MSFELLNPDHKISGHVLSYKLYNVDQTERLYCTAEGLPRPEGQWFQFPISSFEWATPEKLQALAETKISLSPIPNFPEESDNGVSKNPSRFRLMLACLLRPVHLCRHHPCSDYPYRRVGWVPMPGQDGKGMVIFAEKDSLSEDYFLFGVITTHSEVNEPHERMAGDFLDFIPVPMQSSGDGGPPPVPSDDGDVDTSPPVIIGDPRSI